MHLTMFVENDLLSAGARVWAPYKELYHTVESATVRQQADAIQDLEVALRQHKPDFISLLQNPVSVVYMCFSSILFLLLHVNSPI